MVVLNPKIRVTIFDSTTGRLVAGHTLRLINVVTLLWAPLVHGCVTVFGWVLGKVSRYVTSQRGQLSLAIPLWAGEMNTSLGWEGNRRSGVAVAMRHRQ